MKVLVVKKFNFFNETKRFRMGKRAGNKYKKAQKLWLREENIEAYAGSESHLCSADDKNVRDQCILTRK